MDTPTFEKINTIIPEFDSAESVKPSNLRSNSPEIANLSIGNLKASLMAVNQLKPEFVHSEKQGPRMLSDKTFIPELTSIPSLKSNFQAVTGIKPSLDKITAQAGEISVSYDGLVDYDDPGVSYDDYETTDVRVVKMEKIDKVKPIFTT